MTKIDLLKNILFLHQSFERLSEPHFKNDVGLSTIRCKMWKFFRPGKSWFFWKNRKGFFCQTKKSAPIWKTIWANWLSKCEWSCWDLKDFLMPYWSFEILIVVISTEDKKECVLQNLWFCTRKSLSKQNFIHKILLKIIFIFLNNCHFHNRYISCFLLCYI